MINDVTEMIIKYGFDKDEFDAEKLAFRVSLLKEEYMETITAYNEGDAEEFVDGLIDLMVIAIGTLQLAGVNTQKAWDQVHSANMNKERGIKPGRESSRGFDLIKNTGWEAPNHEKNVGVLREIFKS